MTPSFCDTNSHHSHQESYIHETINPHYNTRINENNTTSKMQANVMNAMNSGKSIMKEHDPNDDPFAALSAEVDAKQLVSPMEFGSGAAAPVAEKKEETPSPPSTPSKEE